MTRPTRSQSLLSHEASDPLAGTLDPLGLQLGMHPWATIYAAVGMVRRLNVEGSLTIFSLMLTHRAFAPGVVPSQRYVGGLTEQAHRILLPMVFDELKPHGWLREKMATALFTMSRSCRTLSRSRLS